MASTKKGQVTVRGRFPNGTRVELVKVRDESVLRTSPSDKVVETAVVEDNCVRFTKDVELDGRYFVRGNRRGTPIEVRARGRDADFDDSEVLGQEPIGPDRQKLADGRYLDEIAQETEPVPPGEVAPAAKQSHARDVPQRSSTPLGYATPVDPEEQAPYGEQPDSKEGFAQRSDTPEGQATKIPEGQTVKQEDTDGDLVQRSDTPHGVTTPIPAGNAVEVEEIKSSSIAKDLGATEPVKAAARPPLEAGKSAKNQVPAKKSGAKASKSTPKKAAKKAGSKAKKSSPRKRKSAKKR